MYKKIKKIGQGASGYVFKARETATGRFVAIKEIHIATNPKKEMLLTEISAMKDNQHPNIVGFINSFYVQGNLWVVMELMDGGNLTDVLTHYRMKDKQIATVCHEVMRVNIDDRLSKALPFSTRGRSFIETSNLTTYCFP